MRNGTTTITDVSRGWPCNGKFSGKQRTLYECALATSNHMFSIIKPGMRMADVDATARRYNAERLVEAGVMKSVDEIGTYMWHAGAHHIGYDVHDVVEMPEFVAPGMMFCVDIGIYHEEWGIGFRLEDNCLVTENGCENLSGADSAHHRRYRGGNAALSTTLLLSCGRPLPKEGGFLHVCA